MKKLIVLLFIVGVIFGQNVNISGRSSTGVSENYKVYNGAIAISSNNLYTSVDSLFAATTDTATTNWQSLGSVIDMRGYNHLNLFITIDINSSENFRVRAIGKTTASAGAYPFLIETVSSTDVKVSPEYVEFNTDADQSAILKIETDGVPYIQLQYSVGTKGTVAAKVTSSFINKGSK